MRELQRRDEEVALADAEVHRFAGEPDLVRGALERLALPFLRRQQARLLAADVDAGEAAEAERPEELGDVIHADGRWRDRRSTRRRTWRWHGAGPSRRDGRCGLRGTRGCCRAGARCRGRTSSRWGRRRGTRAPASASAGLMVEPERIRAAQRAIQQRAIDVVVAARRTRRASGRARTGSGRSPGGSRARARRRCCGSIATTAPRSSDETFFGDALRRQVDRHHAGRRRPWALGAQVQVLSAPCVDRPSGPAAFTSISRKPFVPCSCVLVRGSRRRACR